MPKTEAERFWPRVDKQRDDGCWLWIGRKFWDGYGVFDVRHQTIRAHRWSYEALVGPIPEGLVIDHLCRNRLCVNPDHLEPVTRKENVLRGFGVTAQNATKNTCPKGHQYDAANTRVYQGSRYCRECHREQEAARRAKKKQYRTHSKTEKED